MNPRNIAIVFTPAILRPQVETVESTLKCMLLVDVIEILIDSCRDIMPSSAPYHVSESERASFRASRRTLMMQKVAATSFLEMQIRKPGMPPKGGVSTLNSRQPSPHFAAQRNIESTTESLPKPPTPPPQQTQQQPQQSQNQQQQILLLPAQVKQKLKALAASATSTNTTASDQSRSNLGGRQMLVGQSRNISGPQGESNESPTLTRSFSIGNSSRPQIQAPTPIPAMANIALMAMAAAAVASASTSTSTAPNTLATTPPVSTSPVVNPVIYLSTSPAAATSLQPPTPPQTHNTQISVGAARTLNPRPTPPTPALASQQTPLMVARPPSPPPPPALPLATDTATSASSSWTAGPQEPVSRPPPAQPPPPPPPRPALNKFRTTPNAEQIPLEMPTVFYPLTVLTTRPLPNGVDPSILPLYLE
ncbi:hypothetical protein Pelo_11109 [Pelomyxa schiedti]|nr:hypothetical protein Pelo_11109 [Pelomyxa schiedti]